MLSGYYELGTFLVPPRGGGRTADSGPCDSSSIPLGEKKENKQKRPGLAHLKKMNLGHLQLVSRTTFSLVIIQLSD